MVDETKLGQDFYTAKEDAQAKIKRMKTTALGGKAMKDLAGDDLE